MMMSYRGAVLALALAVAGSRDTPILILMMNTISLITRGQEQQHLLGIDDPCLSCYLGDNLCSIEIHVPSCLAYEVIESWHL